MSSKKRGGRPVPEESSATGTIEEKTEDAGESAARAPDDSQDYGTFGGLLTRVTWFLAGPMALFIILCGIVRSGSGWLAVLDAVYFAILGLIVWCRWAEQRAGRGATIYGEPTTWNDFRRYLAIILPLAVGAWVIANLVGNHFL